MTIDVRTRLVAWPLLVLLPAMQSSGWQTEQQEGSPEVAATVNDVPILVADVNLRVRQSLGGRQATDEARALAQAEALELLIAQEKVLVQLEKRGEACTDKELEVELKRLEDKLARQEKTLDDYCNSLGVPPSSVKRMLRWQLSWKRCREKYMTDENLQRYYDRHHKEFDGTTLRVAQILLKSKSGPERETDLERARQIRAKIVARQMTFAEAARQYSEAPTGPAGGEQGWISRHAPMPEFFAKAAYELSTGEVSEPIESPFGVHLICCLEVKPGQKDWTQVREPLSNAVAEYLFHWLADRPEPKQDVRYTGKTPHFQPGTRKLANQ